jgi:LysM repeat protein
MLFGVVCVPLIAKAGFLSSLLGNDVYAEKNASANADATASTGADGVDSTQSDVNSQTLDLLQANVSPVSILQDKNSKNDPKNADQIDPSADVKVDNNALQSAIGPTGASGVDNSVTPPAEETSVYVVRQGDTISQIANMFGVSVNTILWANNMKKGDKLTPGDVLFILPISGLEHTVTKGQTLESIAKLYKADVNDIMQYNGITDDSQLAVGDKLIIPNAEKSVESDKPVKDLGASIAKDKQYYQNHPVQNLAGYYIDPVPGARKSQGIHANNAVDLAIEKGTPILAAADGTVTLARTGYNGGFGDLVIISHPNGTETLYAHQSKIATYTGAKVAQGAVIGYVGSTGRSTGPHLHFEVHGARNPGADGSWKY